MSSHAGPAPAHRSVAGIRSSMSQAAPSPTTAHTPSSSLVSSFGSPSTIRADEDFIILELGSRFIRAGFAGDSLPKACLTCGPAQQRRAGDFRAWQQPGPQGCERKWAVDYEMWRYDVRHVDLGLFRDKFDRLLRDAFTRFLLLDSRPRKIGLVLDSALPIPLLSSVLDTLFTSFQTPVVSLMSAPAMVAVGAGLRSALVIDMGWNETVMTSVYEYREVKASRTVRAGRSLNEELYKLIHGLLPNAEEDDESGKRAISFEECQDIACRLMWCRPSTLHKSSQRQSTQLDTVQEQDESDEAEPTQPSGIAQVPLQSTTPPWTLHIPFNKLADVCDDAFFDPSSARCTFDDHELPLHLLLYHHLLQLPVDVRAICMARIVFTGGCSNILGIKERIMDELTSMVTQRGWEPIFGKGVEQLRNNPKLRGKTGTQGDSKPFSTATSSETINTTATAAATTESGSGESDGSRPETGTETPQEDAVEAKIARNRPVAHQFQGQLRAIHSLGAWAGASLLCQMKIPAMATVERELWLQQGANGASRPSDVDVKAQQRQSMGASGLMRGGGGHHATWTLGVWGAL
ncbi:hypothetical protein E4U57_002404 [Claviceps arundinis]|uniref:Actin-related protein RO7 n=1 Tax=Claviceps arundinis TaxID=1623583 RepID=A0A9P7MP66_9HYPO|nr:hypothetical protein E4U56_003874 [Claviceps arundinis]KAG5968965.1 hypothetical protein E4U57_002404 [Claviceps arundinis]